MLNQRRLKTCISYIRREKFKLKVILTAVFLALAFLWLFQYASIDSSNNIDGSWHYTLTGLLHGPQTLGKDLYFNYGPLFERGFTYVNPHVTIKDFVISNVYFSFIAAALIFGLIVFIRSWRKELKAFPLIAVVVGTTLSFSQIDTLFYVSLVVAALALMRETRWWVRLIIITGIDAFSLYKFSFSFALLITLSLALFAGFDKQTWRRTATNWVSAAIVFWLAYSITIWSPNPLYVLRYFHYGIINSMYYSEFMSLPLSYNRSVLIALVVAGLLVCLGVLCYTYEQRKFFKRPITMRLYLQFCPLLILLIDSFFTFKESVVRTDSHATIFVPILFIWCGLLYKYLRETKLHISRYKIWIGVFAFLVVIWLFFWSTYIAIGTTAWPELRQTLQGYVNSVIDSRYNYGYFKKVRTESRYSFDERSHELDKLLSQPGVPPKGAEVIDWGNTTLLSDILTQKGYHVLYEPFLQNYAAHPPTLFDSVYINFLRAHPKAYIFEEETEGSVTQYLPTYQLSNYFEYVLHNYTPIARSDTLRQYFLKPVSQTTETCVPYSSDKVHIGSMITLPRPSLRPNQYLKAKISFTRTQLESLLGLLIKPPQYNIHIYNQDGGEMEWRITKTTLKHGVVVDPLYLNYHDYVNHVPFQLKHMTVNGSLNKWGSLDIYYSMCTFKK